MKRPATHAFSWYEGNPQILNQQLDQFLNSTNVQPSNARAIIAPHAGYRYSGETAAYAYNAISPETIDRVFLLGPSHKVYLKGCALSGNEYYETPIGDITIDSAVIQQLLDTGKYTTMSPNVDKNEHSLELHLPFIQKIMSRKTGSYTLVPVMVGDLSQIDGIANTLTAYLNDDRNLFVISSDFCHWGERFDYSPCDSSMPIHSYIEQLDHKGMELISSLSYNGFLKYLKETHNTICGRNPILLLLRIIELLGSANWELKFVKYSQSSKVVDKRDSSVSYASAFLLKK
ncbi:Protein memo1 [Boothiomyces sp. JEL0866]|nr:Protein memo1 [Boothiomyces sp. JEL0866]